MNEKVIMRVKDLIEILSKYNSEANVFLFNGYRKEDFVITYLAGNFNEKNTPTIYLQSLTQITEELCTQYQKENLKKNTEKTNE